MTSVSPFKEMSLNEQQEDLTPENWSNIPIKQIIEELIEIKKRLKELEARFKT
jgi:hypothetical protein